MNNPAYLIHNEKKYTLPTITGSDGGMAIDTSSLLRDAGVCTFDPEFRSVALSTDNIVYRDFLKGVITFYGYNIEDLASSKGFLDLAYLTIEGELPSVEQLDNFSSMIDSFSLLDPRLNTFLACFSLDHTSLPVRKVINALFSTYSCFSNIDESWRNEGNRLKASAYFLSVVPVIAAVACRLSIGQSVVPRRRDLGYTEKFLSILPHTDPVKGKIDSMHIQALEQYWILTSAIHDESVLITHVLGKNSNIYDDIVSYINASGSVNSELVIFQMLSLMYEDGRNVEKYISKSKNKADAFRIEGFGHRTYATFDPRANTIKNVVRNLINRSDLQDPYIEIALTLEELVMSDDYFASRNLYPSFDFYSTILLKALGIPAHFFPVVSLIGRLPLILSYYFSSSSRRKFYKSIYTGELGRPLPET